MIEELRKQIDELDAELVNLLAKRMDLSRQIGQEKAQSGEDIHVRTREIAVLDQVKLLGNQVGLADEFMTDLYQVVLAESRKVQGS